MDHSTEDPMDKFRKAPRLYLGKNTCSNCGKDFILKENKLPMPGTKDLESVFCPYCKVYNGEVILNGTAYTEKIGE